MKKIAGWMIIVGFLVLIILITRPMTPSGMVVKIKPCVCKADISALSSAIELYFEKNKQYPRKLNDLIPEFMGLIPKSPYYPEYDSYKYKNNNEIYEIWCSSPFGNIIYIKNKKFINYEDIQKFANTAYNNLPFYKKEFDYIIQSAFIIVIFILYLVIRKIIKFRGGSIIKLKKSN